MRHINTDRLQASLPTDWEKNAVDALNEVRAAGRGNRNAVIKRHSHLWTELKEILSGLSTGKCWYCEVQQIRSDKSVDHFRPKGKVEGVPAHEGYWWLAFDWSNYRFSCTFCNQQHKNQEYDFNSGKQAHFPLLNEDQRAFLESDDWKKECPTLIDPTHAEDITLLWFTEDGRATEKFSKKDHPFHYERAHTSIILYHLNHSDIKEARLNLIKEVKDLVAQGNLYFVNSQSGSAEARRGYEITIKRLHEKISQKAELSSTAKATLLALSSQNDWVEALLMSA